MIGGVTPAHDSLELIGHQKYQMSISTHYQRKPLMSPALRNTANADYHGVISQFGHGGAPTLHGDS